MELQPMQIVIEGGDISGQAKKPKPGKEMAVQAVPVTESRFGAKNPKSPDGRRPSASPSLDAAPSSNKPKRPRLPLGLATEIRRRHRSTDQQEKPNLSFIKELAATRKLARQSSVFDEAEVTVSPSPMTEEGPYVLGAIRALKTGNLTKTSQSVGGNKSNPGFSRHRRFRLTKEALEYFHTFNHVKVKRSYPLTAVEKVEYDNTQNPLLFKLVFSTYILSLQADTEEDARDWVEKINDAWSKWLSPEEEACPELGESSTEPFEVIPEEDEVLEEVVETGREDSPAAEEEEKEEEYCPVVEKEESLCYDDDVITASEEAVPTAVKHKKWVFHRPASTPGGKSPPSLRQTRTSSSSSQSRARSTSDSAFLKRERSEDAPVPTYDSRKRRLSRKAFRIARLRPQLERTDRMTINDPDREHDPAQDKLHTEFSMLKYPSKLFRFPNERLFTVDKDNLQILWKKVSRSGYQSGFRQKSSLSLRRIVEVRRGQRTPYFDKFPYEQHEDRSFSLLFETETNKYAKLSSLDVICDHQEAFLEWMEGLSTLVSSSQWLSISPPRYENSDPTILWLKMIWTCKSENREVKQRDAIKIVKKFIPQTTKEHAKIVVELAHDSQVKHTFNYGAALRWDGFVLLFHLLCDKKDLQLYDIFRQYALQHQDLGMTNEEFRRFLITECHWLPAHTKPSILHSLMRIHDQEHHQAVKKFYANNKPEEFKTASKLLSFAGFLSFLRSRDNAVIDLQHETVYQDMTQPLSHYFINSSHNTYLEGDQLTGTSSTDAYVRTLLQGCRCIEIDCWDGVRIEKGLSEKEAVIYHGYTLTTKIAFRDVIHAINDTAFNSSIYPIIISIENHCSPAQQSRMAKVFRAIFETRLPTVNLCEMNPERDRLPSPEELQGKVLLKGSYQKSGPSRTADRKPNKILKKLRAKSQAQLQLQNADTLDTKLKSKSPTARSPTEVTSLPPDTLKSRSHTTAVGTSLPVGMKPRSPTSIVASSLNPFQFPPTLESSPSPSHNLNSSVSPSHHNSESPAANTIASANPLSSIDPEASLSLTTTNLVRPPSKDIDTKDPPESSIKNFSFRSSKRKHKLEAIGDQVDSGHDPFHNSRINRRSFRRLQDRLAQREIGYDDQELEFEETDEDLKKLIVYCRSVTIKPWDWKLQRETSVSEMFSFGEPTAVELCKHFKRDMLRCTERQLVRTYPKGSRFDSSNYDPMQMWNCGVQMVALNFQHPDVDMHLNQGFFRNNGGCGYVLKPVVMRRDDPGGSGYYRGQSVAPFSPDMMVPHPAVTPVQLEIELLSGQRLCSWKKKCNYVTVDIQTYGIKHDCGKMKQATHNRAFWPSWKKGEHVLQQEIFMPELCLLYIRVENEGKKIYGQNCFPVSSLLPGLKFIPMRTNGGELIPESGVFMRIKKSEGVSGSESTKFARKAKVPSGSPNHMANHKSQPAGQASLKRKVEDITVKVEKPAEKVEEEVEEETVEVEVHFNDPDSDTELPFSSL